MFCDLLNYSYLGFILRILRSAPCYDEKYFFSKCFFFLSQKPCAYDAFFLCTFLSYNRLKKKQKFKKTTEKKSNHLLETKIICVDKSILQYLDQNCSGFLGLFFSKRGVLIQRNAWAMRCVTTIYLKYILCNMREKGRNKTGV